MEKKSRCKPPKVLGIEHKKMGQAKERWLDAGGTANTENNPVKHNGVKRHSMLFKLPYWKVSDFVLIRFI